MILYVYSGSFNPLHDGHIKIANHVYNNYVKGNDVDRRLVFEITKRNADKGSVSERDIRDRVNSIAGIGFETEVTDCDTFSSKFFELNKRYKDQNVVITFVVGDDTLERINDLKYYHDSEECFETVNTILKNNGVQYLVIPRYERQIELRPILKEMCFWTDFEPVNISSTELRKKDKLAIIEDKLRKAVEDMWDRTYKPAKYYWNSIKERRM